MEMCIIFHLSDSVRKRYCIDDGHPIPIEQRGDNATDSQSDKTANHQIMMT